MSIDGRGSKPGERRGGRKLGSKNKNTTILKDAILKAAELVGEDGAGKDGVVGYLKMLALNERKAFASMMSRVLPLQVTGENGGAINIQMSSEDRGLL